MPPLGSLIRPLARWGRGIGGLGGAAYGASTAEEDESPALRALGYGALGGVMLPMGAAALQRGYQAGGAAGALTDYTYFSFLSSPDTILRGNFGAIGGAVSAALEKVAEGAARGRWEEAAQGGRILKSLFTEGPKIWGKALKANPEEFQRMYRQYMPEELSRFADKRMPGAIEQHTGGRGIGKLFGAPDMAAVHAMRQGGFSASDAARYTLTGTPQSKVGQHVLQGIHGFRGKGPMQEFLAVQAAPFARVGLLGLEKGLQRIPGVGYGAHALMKSGVSPLKQTIQQGLGATAMAAGYKGEDFGLDPRVGLVAGPLAGPAFLPFAAGRELRRQRERGDTSALSLAGEMIKESSPLGFQPLGVFYNPRGELPRRVIPAGVADIAEALDPAFGRERGQATLKQAAQRGEYTGPTGTAAAGALSRLPDLREQLPETFSPVDIFGRQRFEGTEPALPYIGRALTGGGPVRAGISRAVFPSRERTAPPAMNLLDPQMAELAELGITPGPPSSRVTLPGTDLPLRQTAQSAAATQRRGGIPAQIAAQIVTKMMSRPEMRALSPVQRNMMARRLMDELRGRVGRALPSRLVTALTSGARLPTLPREP